MIAKAERLLEANGYAAALAALKGMLIFPWHNRQNVWHRIANGSGFGNPKIVTLTSDRDP
jgi:hypothetical protein